MNSIADMAALWESLPARGKAEFFDITGDIELGFDEGEPDAQARMDEVCDAMRAMKR